MDRRTFLAFALIFIILAGYPILMEKLYPGDPDPEPNVDVVNPDPDTESGVSREVESGRPDAIDMGPTEGLDTGPGTVAEATIFAGRNQEQTVTVRTPLYELVISTLGGRVVHWRGFEHDSWQGGPVQLLPEELPPAGSDLLLFRETELDLGKVVYRTDQTGIDLSEGSGPASVTLAATTTGGLEVRKIFTFDPEAYGFQVDFVLAMIADDARTSLNLLGSPESFRFGWNQGLIPTERIQKMEKPTLRTVAAVGEDLHFKKLMDLEKDIEKASGSWRGSIRFAGIQNKYFCAYGIVPREQGEPVEGRITLGGDPELMVQSWTIELPARRGVGEEIAVARLDMYIGPQQAELLQVYEQGLEKSMDLGWKLFRPLSEAVLWCLEFMHRFIPNYGLIIILFSVLTKLMFYPLTKTSTESMKKMQEVQPKLKALQEKYKNDKDKLNQATMQLYRDEKVNPLAGCIPLLVQSPVFIALYQALNHTISLRGQPFFAWITDLSQPDALATMPFALPFLGSDLNVLPILMAVAMYFQTKMTPTGSAGGQMAVMNTMMPLVMIFIFYNMPSGLVLYWLVNTILQGYQSWKIHQTAPASGGAQTT